MDRRFFLQISALAAASHLVGWRFAGAAPKPDPRGGFDAVVVGAGLGGLCCAAHLAKNGFKTVLIEQYDVPGGYATSFTRSTAKGDFSCEVSLHSSVLRSPKMRSMLEDVGVWNELTLVDHRYSWSSRFPDFAIDVPAKCGLDGFERQLANLFPGEKAGLAAYFQIWRTLMREIAELEKIWPAGDRSKFPEQFPTIWNIRDKTVGALVDANIKDHRLKAVLTQSCGYYGLPPSQLSAFYYLLPTGEYLEIGGSYVKGTSQALSNALAASITKAGGEVLYQTRVTSITTENGRITDVKTGDGREFKTRTVVCNASAPQVFETLLAKEALPEPYRAKLGSYSNSPSSFIVWLGLNRDITRDFPHAEVAYYGGYEMDTRFNAALDGDFANAGFGLMVYDNLVPGFSPPGCSTITLMNLCGFEMWKDLEADYLAGRREAYEARKKRLTDELISMAEKQALPGLSKMIVMSDSATPLTNQRFTLNAGGALYGYNQTVDNSFMARLDNKTPVDGLYLASAWGNPGGGYGGVLLGGKAAFKKVATYLARA